MVDQLSLRQNAILVIVKSAQVGDRIGRHRRYQILGRQAVAVGHGIFVDTIFVGIFAQHQECIVLARYPAHLVCIAVTV